MSVLTGRSRLIAGGNKEGIEAEFGDLLFAVVNAARLYGVSPENALDRTNRKFIRRFNYVENRVKESGRNLKEMNLQVMDALWNEAKAAERNSEDSDRHKG